MLSAGCGGASPLLHPARTLPAGDVRALAGISAQIVPGSIGDDLKAARARPDTTTPEFAKGAIVAASVSPGLAPVAGARVGVGNAFEGGLVYTGRAVRVDMRRSFDSGKWSLSLGVGASAALFGRQEGKADLPNLDLGALRGYGADVPILGGWQSDGGLYMLWFGPRVGVEYVSVETLSTEPRVAAPNQVTLEATRFYGGGVVGLATGFKHVHVAIEIGAAYHSATGTYDRSNVSIGGLVLTPASALWWTF